MVQQDWPDWWDWELDCCSNIDRCHCLCPGLIMSKPYLEVTYREGRPFAAYLYLNRLPSDKSARTERHGSWVVDFSADGRAIGIEFTVPGSIDLAEVNRILSAARHPAVSDVDLAPLKAA